MMPDSDIHGKALPEVLEVSPICTIASLSISTKLPGPEEICSLAGTPGCASAMDSVPVYTDPSSSFTMKRRLLSSRSISSQSIEIVPST